MKQTSTIIALLFLTLTAQAKDPFFSIFKENYIVTGVPLNTRPNYDTNDIAFQASVRLNVAQDFGRTNDWNMFLGYTQQAIWDFYMPSNPFRSNTYEYGLYFQYKRNLLFGYEHRSNGINGQKSRSLDYAFASLTHDFGRHFTAQAFARLGIGSIGNDFDFELFRYQGFVTLSGEYHTLNRRFLASACVIPIFRSEQFANVTLEVAWRPTRNIDWMYLTLRYHYGYDENQLDCGDPDVFLKQMLRVGISVQPGVLAHKLYF